jgi:hypothetical protein
MLRVVQWATGNLGRAAIEGIVSHPELELVGVWVHSDDKAGRDAGELAGIEDTGVIARQGIEHVLDLAPDCVLYGPIMPVEDEIVRLLESGIDVVTPLGWFYPKLLDTTRIDAACEQGSATLHGTGIHPGGMTERLPLVLSAFSRDITHVVAEEYSDCRTYGATDVLANIMLFGKTPEEASRSIMLAVLGGGFAQSIQMVADELGFALDPELRIAHDIGVATAPVDSPIGTIDPGCMAAQRFSWQGTVGGEPVVTARVHWYMGRDDIDADWLAGDHPEGYFLRVEGDPPVEVALSGIHPHGDESLEALQQRNPGMVATAIHCVSAIPYVCAAEPGIKSYLDLPLVAGRAAPALRRARAHGVERA